MSRTVGIVGVGKMGVPIAANLIERGWRVLGYRRSAMDDFVAVGGEPAESPAAVASDAAAVITILPDPDALHDVVFGDGGLLTASLRGVPVVEMSTLPQSDKDSAREAIRSAGGDLLDCPISGIPAMIPHRAATVFASGEPATIEQVAPVLDDIGPWLNAGAFGCGARLKYVANLLVSVHNAVAAESISFAEKVGLDPQLVLDAISGTIASSTTFEKRVPMMLDGRWELRPGPISTMYDILEQIEDTGHEFDASLPIFEASKSVYSQAMADGWGALDISSLVLRYRGEDYPTDTDPPAATGDAR